MRRDPFAANPSQAPINALEYFTNREGFIEAFDRHVHTRQGLDLSVLVFYGVGGIGKTTLLRKLCANLAQSAATVPYVRYNLENVTDQAQAYRDVLMRLRSDLESGYHLKFPQFDLALSVLLAQEGGARPSLVKISPGLSSAFDAAMEFTPSVIKAGVKFAGHQLRTVVKSSSSLENWVRQVGGTEAVLELSERFAQDDQIVQDELIRRFAQDLAQMPERPGRACRGVLFLDTYESLWTGRDSHAAQARQLDAWVRTLTEYLLGAGILLVIAGRDRLNWSDHDPDWETCLDQHLLGGVSAHDAQSFLARRGIGVAPPQAPDALQAAILRCADTSAGAHAQPSCHLLALALSGDIVLNTRQAGTEPDPALFRGVPPAKIASELATRFLKSLHNRNLELWVEALSLTPRFDENVALALDGARQLHTGRAGWEQMRHYSFVTAQPNGFFRMHRTMREVLRGRTADSTVQTLHAWFEEYWQAQGEESLAFYHRWCRDPDGVLSAWFEVHNAAVEAGQAAHARALLTRWSEVALDEDDRYLLSEDQWARAHVTRGEALRSTPLSPRPTRLTGAMQHFRSALTVLGERDAPESWAKAQDGLGRCYLDLTIGDRIENLHLARECFHAASRAWSEDAQPLDWAAVQISLGLTHAYLPTGDKAENLLAATRFFEATLRVWTKDAWPKKWAQIQNNLGCTALLMPGGDHALNLHRAIGYFDAVLDVVTQESWAELWGKVHHNLGIVYYDLPDGNRDENLRRSMSHYESALRVNTEEDRPDAWAETQNSLGTLHRALSGDAAANLRRALEHYRAAQRVWTPEDNADRWAQAQMNSGDAYWKLREGDRVENLRAAIACYRSALSIHTEAVFPEAWARSQQGLGLALQDYASVTGDARVQVEVPGCFADAARGFLSIGLVTEAEEAERLLAKSETPGENGTGE